MPGVTWDYRGLLLPAPVPLEWATTHAALPHAHVLPDGTVRLFFSSRDERVRSHIGAADLDLSGREPQVRLLPEPLLDPGPRGAFDDSGVTTSCLVVDGDRQLLYYTGWSLGADGALLPLSPAARSARTGSGSSGCPPRRCWSGARSTRT